MCSGTLHPGHRLTVNCSSHPRLSDANTELITLLTKQLSKQHMMGSVPALALTPRGTGAGYGVGMDLDAMLTDAQDNAGLVLFLVSIANLCCLFLFSIIKACRTLPGVYPTTQACEKQLHNNHCFLTVSHVI